MARQFSTVQAAVEAITRGEVVIVVDAEDRENEGDFICAAEKATPSTMNFIMSGRGIPCLAVLPEVAKRLGLLPISDHNTTPMNTAYVTPIDHRSSRTGVTAEERSRTIIEAVNPNSRADDFVRPGHVSTLVAKEGGVLRRAGHTEAAVDLARMAGLAPAGVLCEVLNDRGERATREQLLSTAAKHNLAIISIEELIAHRRLSEKLVYPQAQASLPTRFGTWDVVVYGVKFEEQEPFVMMMGDPAHATNPPLVRMHSSCYTGDVLASLRCDCGDQLRMALEMISHEQCGVLVYLPQEGRGIGLTEKIKAYALQDGGLDTVEANHALGYKADMRDYGVGIQILKDLGLTRVRLLTNNPKKIDALFNARGFGLEVVDQVAIVPPANEYNAQYLATKREKLGHILPS